jgi:hyperosmotically inducible protein
MPIKRFARTLAVRTCIAGIALAVFVTIPLGFAKSSKDRNNAFVAGDVDETRIAREVRHQLLMLPYYGIFDDLSFRVN